MKFYKSMAISMLLSGSRLSKSGIFNRQKIPDRLKGKFKLDHMRQEGNLRYDR